jgi:signal transduction histidine kinase
MQVLAQQCAQALERGRRYAAEREARAAAERSQDRLALLADASAVLGASLDYAVTLRRVAALAVPRLADMCRVVMSGDGVVEQVGLAAAPTYLAAAGALLAEYPFDPDDPYGESLVLRTGESLLMPQVDMQSVLAGARDERHRHLLQQLDLLAYMIVPLRVRGQTLGAMTFVSTRRERPYGPGDLKLAEDLASRIAIAVDNARLYREAQDAIRLRDVFLSIASHELNTPITALLGFSDILWRQIENDEHMSERERMIAKTINEQAIRLQKLTSMLLDVSRIQTDRLQLEWSQVDLCTLVARAAEQIGSTTERHTIAIDCAPDTSIEADELRLEQVLFNLIQNAVKYSPAGGEVEVIVRTEPTDVVIAVRDHGVGIPAAELEQLFSRFFRGSNVDYRRISGMGLGLFIVKQIVDLHGGTVDAESREGAGSTFRVRLPRVRAGGVASNEFIA